MRHVLLPLALIAAPLTAQAPTPATSAAAAGPTYADLADLAAAAPIVAGAEIARATQLKGPAAAGVPAGQARFYVQADVAALLRGANGLPAQVSYLVDVPLDARGRAPKLKRTRVLLLAAPVPGKPGELRLAAPRAQLDWTPANEQRLRAILTALVSPEAPPRITGIANAFHVAGSLPGESETQIFLTTAERKPVSLSILRRPGQQVRWAVSLSDIVDEAAAPPRPETLLWYRLACALPATLPETATAALSPADAAAARADYRVVIQGLGPCARSGAV